VAKAITFTPDAAARITEAVRAYETGGRSPAPQAGRTASPRVPMMWPVRIAAGATPDGFGRYPGYLQVYDVATNAWSDLSGSPDCLVKPIN
jgi:hypothetical protein